ncbi:MAG: DUF5107 domain-containing protein [Victivallales bacterium]|nr:DUF5107 domain-containing protein [Victivallales bacterium]
MLDLRTVELVIPTYERGPDDAIPPLTFGGARRGRRRPFPYAMQDDIDIATMRFDPQRRYRAVVLNNGLVEAIVLPEMNGRLYSLRDLRTGREMFYRNQVVKPALVALRGAWISGGIEFNFPTLGHSVSTVSPVAFGVERGTDEIAVWVGDLDRGTRQRWRVRLSLKEGRAALDTRVELSNPNLWRERLYYWENAAVPAGGDMRFVCQCDWTVGASSQPFPRRDGKDVSLHVNNPNPCDHFGYRSHADFFGAHYGDGRCGTYHVAPRIEAPGQKYFTWGTREDNKIWEGYLTDADGQYVEIQSGILETQWFTGWLDPLQTLRTEGSWFGVSDCPELAWANSRLGVAVQEREDGVALSLHSVDLAEEVTAVVRAGGQVAESSICLCPGQAVSLPVLPPDPFQFEVRSRSGRLLLAEAWSGPGTRGLAATRPTEPPAQWGMQARSQPAARVAESEVKYHRWESAQQALTKHAASVPELDATRVQAEIALKTAAWGRAWELSRAVTEGDSEDHLAHAFAMVAALGRLRAGDGHAYYDAYDHALVVRNNSRYAATASLVLGEASLLAGRPLDAAIALERAVAQAPDSREARLLLAAARRACGEDDMDVPALVQQELMGCDGNPALAAEAFLELVFVWWRAGCGDCLAEALPLAPEPDHPAVRLLTGAAPLEAGGVLSRWEEADLLRQALDRDGEQPAWNYLLAVWEVENARVQQGLARLAGIAARDSGVSWLAHCVLADHAAHVAGQPEAAVVHLEAVLAARPEDHRLLCWLDDLLRGLQDLPSRRERWASVSPALRQRGDIVFRLARLALDEGRGADAAAMLLAQRFSVYEGGTSIRRLYVDALLVAALAALVRQDSAAAAGHCRAVLEYPENLGAASYLGEHSRLVRFLLGEIASRSAQTDKAEEWWRDVLARSGGSTAYTVGGEDAAGKLRDDERVAVWLSAERLGENPTGTAIPIPTEKPASEGALRAALVASIRTGSRNPDWECLALASYPCSPLLRILVGLASVPPREECSA